VRLDRHGDPQMMERRNLGRTGLLAVAPFYGPASGRTSWHGMPLPASDRLSLKPSQHSGGPTAAMVSRQG
jgi:hypothetical protein